MIIGSHNPDAGLFSHINLIITHLEFHDARDIHVDWTEGLPYSQPSRGNLFEHLFVQFSARRPGDEMCRGWPHYDYTYRNAWKLYKADDRWRWDLNSRWRNFQVRPEILEEVESFRSSWPDQVIGLHVRNLNISSECPGSLCPTLEDYRRSLEGSDAPVFLATDNMEAVEFFREVVGERLISRAIHRARDMSSEYHLAVEQTIEDARNCLVDALLLASCQLLIHSVSNIATAVLYMNPSLRHVPLLGRRSLHGKTDPQKAARRYAGGTGGPSPAPSLIHVEHPAWNDWIVLGEDGSFYRHDDPSEGGEWRISPNSTVILHWNNWPAEEFELKEPVCRPDATRNGVNAVNSLCYRFAKAAD